MTDVSGERIPRAAMPAATAAGEGGLACRLCSTSMNGRCRLFFAACLLPLVACQLVAARGEDPAKLARWPILVVRTTPWEKLAAHPEARVEGVVIRSTPTTLVIQDETGGLYVNISRAIERGWLPGPLEPKTAPVGHEVTIEGVLEPGGFAPIIVPRTIALLGPKPLPEPRRKDPAVLLSGGYDSELVEFTGIVQAVRKRSSYTVLAMNFREQEVIVALAPDALDIDPNRLLDAEVRLRGVAAATFTPRGEFRDAIVYVEQPGWIEIVVPSPRDVLLEEAIPLRDVGRFRAMGDTGHLLRTGGTVVYSIPGEAVYLQDGAWGLRAETDSSEVFQPGDRVEAIGFLDRRSPVAGLCHAEIRRAGSGPPPEPVAITPEEILSVNRQAARGFVLPEPGDYHGCLVRFPARLVRSREEAGTRQLVLDAAGDTVLARLRDDHDGSLDDLLPDSELEVTGIVDLQWDQARKPKIVNEPQRVAVLVRSPADIVVTRPPSPWTPKRLALLLGLATTALGLVGGWAWWLRQQRERLELMVVQRTAELAEAREQEKRQEDRQRELLEQKLKTSLTASAVAHEINQPLSRLLLKCRLEADRDEGGKHDAFIDAVVQDAERIVTTIEKMKVLLRNVETSHEPVDLAQVVTSALLQVKRLLVNNAIAVHRVGPPSGCLITGDDVQLQFAISNLLRNAAEAIVAGGTGRREIGITIREEAGQQGETVELVIGDGGPGWPGGPIEEVLLATSKPQGTGIGLFVVATAVKNHHGSISVGRSPLGGAEFRIVLPRQPAG
jgi:signal transduction histidine kinase